MKRILVVAAFLTILFSANDCFAQPYVSGFWSGKWKSISASPQTGPMSCTVTQSGELVSGSATIWSTVINGYVTLPVSGTIKTNGYMNMSGSAWVQGYYCTGYVKGWVVGNTLAGGYGYTASGQWQDFGSCRLIFRY